MVSSAYSRFRYVYDWYNRQFAHKHGRDRYYWENLPLFGKLHKFASEAERADDYYRNTGTDDYYGDRYAHDSISSLFQDLTGPLRPRRMARDVQDIFGADIQEDVSWRASPNRKKRR